MGNRHALTRVVLPLELYVASQIDSTPHKQIQHGRRGVLFQTINVIFVRQCYLLRGVIQVDKENSF
jgi:hypothetical protein